MIKLKLEGVEGKMQEHCFSIYWAIDDIEENLMFMVSEILEQNLSIDLEETARELLSQFLGATTFLRSDALELSEKFALFIFDPGRKRIQFPEQDTGDIVQTISDVLNEQAVKLDYFIRSLIKKNDNNEITDKTIVLFCESGGNILNDKRSIVKSLRFLANNYNKYQYEINSKNTTSN